MHRTVILLVAACLALGVGRVAAEAEPEAEAAPERDPWQGFNRAIFRFNDKVDAWVLEPVATGWDTVTPKPVQRGISNFFENLRFPIRFVNDVLQGKLLDGAQDVGRFVVNTMIGGVGFLDPASELGLAKSNEDFGQTLGRWGVPPGPYLVLPFFGASNIRDTGGLAFDSAASITPFFVDTFILAGVRVVDIVNTRAQYLREVEEAKAASLDYYLFVRDAYSQRRRALIRDAAETEERTYGDDLYEVNDEPVLP